jgi:hypothetical protein
MPAVFFELDGFSSSVVDVRFSNRLSLTRVFHKSRGREGTNPREFEFEQLPHARLTDEDDKNENCPQYVEYSHNLVVQTVNRHENNYAY